MMQNLNHLLTLMKNHNSQMLSRTLILLEKCFPFGLNNLVYVSATYFLMKRFKRL